MSGQQREPIYVAQTFDREHTCTPEAAKSWFSDRFVEATQKGGYRSRRTVDKGGLLIEVWDDPLPPDQGKPRWMFAASESR